MGSEATLFASVFRSGAYRKAVVWSARSETCTIRGAGLYAAIQAFIQTEVQIDFQAIVRGTFGKAFICAAHS